MKYIFLLLVCTFTLSANAQNGKSKFSLSLGKTAFIFDNDNPLSFGNLAFGSSELIPFTIPRIELNTRISGKHSVKLSYERFGKFYWRRSGPMLEIGEVEKRNMQILTVTYGYDLFERSKLLVAVNAGFSYRFDGDAYNGESWVQGYSQLAGNFQEAIIDGRKLKDIGIGGQLVLRYQPWRRISFSSNIEYFLFSDRPSKHVGLGLGIGYHFGFSN
jgi:hypothetical protein